MPSKREPIHARFPFTARDTPALRARIQGDLQRVADRARDMDPALEALVLTGGFSRGEGSATNDVPLNDYDLLAIRKRPGGEARYRSLAQDLTRELGIEVDLLPVWRARLPHVAKKLFWLDVRLGARVIAGDPFALVKVRAFGPGELAPGEIARLLGNRAAGLLLALPGDGEEPDPAQRDLQAAKAAIAAMDATILHRGLYPPHLRDRLRAMHDHTDHHVFHAAVEWKLGARPLPEGFWERARDALLRAVDDTGARHHHDGLAERAMHLARARRLALAPSQAVRRRAWDLLATSAWPGGPAAVEWRRIKRDFFAQRAKTLQ